MRSIKSIPTLALVAGAVAGLSAGAYAEPAVIEEVVVVGRSLDAAQQLLNERMDDDAVVDVLDADTISRLGDSTVAASLRRMTGLSLVNDKFVYVRGLGERYSATTLGGAVIPSPDLTRNVIPLDLFPASVVSSLKVQKTFSPDIIANFAGGLIDIRTRSFPHSGFGWSIEGGVGSNSETSRQVLGYAGGSDDQWGSDDGTRALSRQLADGLNEYQGNLSPSRILQNLRQSGQPDATFADAQAINRQLALALNRNIQLTRTDSSPDYNLRGSVGSSLVVGDDTEVGFQISASYDQGWRETVRKTYSAMVPEEQNETERESTFSANLNTIFTTGLDYTEDHEFGVTYLFIRNSDDEAATRDFFNENRQQSDGIGFRDYRAQFEQRELNVLQFRGTHRMGYETREKLAFIKLPALLPEETEVSWFYSDATATTDLPNQVNVSTDTVTDRVTGAVQEVSVQRDTGAADFRFTSLEDDVLSYGYTTSIPVDFGSTMLEIRFGYQYDRKARRYEQREFGLGSFSAPASVLSGQINEVFSNASVTNPEYGFELGVQGQGARSYLAATATTGYFVMADWLVNDTYRLTFGLRREDYIQAALPWNVYGYNVDSTQLPTDVAVLETAAFQASDLFPSVTLAYFSDWLAEEFQLRFSWSQTAIRPDLREVTEASYVDPISGELVFGNSGVGPASVDNYDLRADWFFANKNSLTVSLFDKDISDPIEFFETPASDTNRARSIVNAESTRIRGLELEGLVRLGMLGRHGELFFVQGNATFQDSETVAGSRADAPTNNVRSATGASDYLLNLMLGFDSDDGKYTASLIYNVFGARLYKAGRLGGADEFEQPFHSLDATFSWYPTDRLTLKLKLQNILDESITIRSGDVVVFEEAPGSTVAARLKYEL
jgi:TonB-dependent receptor